MSYSTATFRFFFVYFFITSIIYRLHSRLVFLQHGGAVKRISCELQKREQRDRAGASAVETQRLVKRENYNKPTRLRNGHQNCPGCASPVSFSFSLSSRYRETAFPCQLQFRSLRAFTETRFVNLVTVR